MNRRRWADPEVPTEILGLKLAEETGEVTNVISDNLMAHKGPMTDAELEYLIEECEHVIFIATLIQSRAFKAAGIKKA